MGLRLSLLTDIVLELVGELVESWLNTPRRKAIALAALGATAAATHVIGPRLPVILPGWLSVAMLVANLICGVAAVASWVVHRSEAPLFALAFALNVLAFALAWL